MLVTHVVSIWGKGGVEKFIETFPAPSQKTIIGKDFKALKNIQNINEETLYLFHSPPYFLSILFLIISGKANKIGIFVHNDLSHLYSITKKIVIYPWLAFLSIMNVKVLYLSSCNDFLRIFCKSPIKMRYISESLSNIKVQKQNRRKIIFVSRQAEDKRLDRAIKIFQSLNVKNVTLEVWGHGYDEIMNDNDWTKVNFCGYTESLDTVYDSNKILLITSEYESGPLTAIEALQRGMPVISTRVGIFKHLNNDTRFGYRVFDKDEEAKSHLEYFLNQQSSEEDPRDFLQTITYNKQEFFDELMKNFKHR